jgi:hypothetical protein
MKWTVTALLVVGVLMAGGTVPALAFHDDAGRLMGEAVDQFHALAGQLEQYLHGHPLTIPWGVPSAEVERPLISFMLDHRDQLALTPEQVARLDALRTDFAREFIRREADIRVAELDLQTLLAAERLDMPKVEAKIRELATRQADLRIERLRTIDQGRAVLTAEQRTKLQAMLGGPPRPGRRAARGVRM